VCIFRCTQNSAIIGYEKKKLLLKQGIGNGDNAEAGRRRFQDNTATGFKGGAGGNYIVYQQNMPVQEAFGLSQCKSVLQVL
jgi:hypothetical protein